MTPDDAVPVHAVRRIDAIDLAGQTIGKVEVLGVHEGPGEIRWLCKCECGERFVASSVNLREAGKNYRCSKCRRRPGQSRVHNCSICHSSAHNRRNCPDRKEDGAGKFCGECFGLGHRRPHEGCPGCGAAFVEERSA